mmetsp:Transcript_22616/g.65213  ORF Transcript_22616/g.65213 Transcript_22616/m.65213 type:complete len:86 (-) Transcript_22616:31-288(-)
MPLHVYGHAKSRTELSLVIATPTINDTIRQCQSKGFASGDFICLLQNLYRFQKELIDRCFSITQSSITRGTRRQDFSFTSQDGHV